MELFGGGIGRANDRNEQVVTVNELGCVDRSVVGLGARREFNVQCGKSLCTNGTVDRTFELDENQKRAGSRLGLHFDDVGDAGECFCQWHGDLSINSVGVVDEVGASDDRYWRVDRRETLSV